MKKYFLITTQISYIYHGLMDDASSLISKRGGSRSIAYDTIDELKKGEGILEDNCPCCGGYIKTTFTKPTKSEIIQKKLCFSCLHWNKILDDLSNPNRFIIGGNAYCHVEQKEGYFQGHGGRTFRIKRYDTNEVFVSNNLWCQGQIPIHLKDRIKNNACFI